MSPIKTMILNMCMLFCTILFSQGIYAQTITVSGENQSIAIDATTSTIIAPNFSITSSNDITDFTVSITNSFTASDQLGYNGTLPSGVTTSGWNSGTRSIVFKGTLSASEWQTFLRTITMTSGPICSPETRQVSFVAEETFYSPLNGHFYRLTDTQTSWTASKAAASSISYFGREAYLVTLTSNAENIFVTRIVGENSWMGASDDHNQINEALGYDLYADTNASEGKFYWVTGPEKGTQLTTNNGNGNGISGVYQNWRSGEPNDYSNGNPGESFGHVYSSQGDWNDFPDTSSILGIIEFGDMPNDQLSSTPFFTKDVTINGAPGGNITGGEVSVCSGSNSTTLTLNGLNGSVVRWESSDNNFIDTPTVISNTTTTLTVNNISTTTYYRAIVNTNAPTNCSNLTTSSVPIYVNEADAGNVFAQNTTICSGSNVELFVSGQEGSIQKWQRSSDNANWVDIANTTTILEEAITTTGSWYYRVVTEISGCGTTDISDAKEITVVSGAAPIGGQVSSIIHNSTSNSGTLTLTGQTGTINKWQQSTDNGIIWADISNTTTTYNYTNISATTLFRAELTNGSCGTTYSEMGSVTIDNIKPSGYTVSIDQSKISSANANAVSFTFTGAEVGTTYNYTFSSDGGGTNVTGTGLISTGTDQITGIDLSGLNGGTITLSITLTDAAGNNGDAVTDSVVKGELPVFTAPSGLQDFSSASLIGSKYLGSPSTTRKLGLEFSNDGAKMYTIGFDDDFIVEYTLATPYSVTTATPSHELNITANGEWPRGLAFNADGSKMFIKSGKTKTIYAYNLSIPYDLSTAIIGTDSYDISSLTNLSVEGVDFNTDGTRMYLTNGRTGSSSIEQFDLSTPFEVATASYSGSKDISSRFGSSVYGIAFGNGGMQMFIGHYSDGRIVEYSLTAPYDVTTASLTANNGNVLSQSTPTDIFFSADFNKVFILYYGQSKAMEYSINNHSLDFEENNVNPVTNVDANDGDGGGADIGITYSLTSGGDNDFFTINGATGELTFQASPDFETAQDSNGDNRYELSVVATDSDGGTTLNITVEVTDVDEVAPAGYTVGVDQDPINADNEDSVSFTFSGAEVGATYNYTFSSDGGGTNITGTGVISNGGEQITGIDLSGLGDGTITLSITLTDTANNVGDTATDTKEKDTVSPSGYTVVVNQNPINTDNEDSVSFAFAGAEVGATYNYTFSSDGGGTAITGTGIIATTTDEITDIDLSGLIDGTVTLSITLTDATGNEGTPAIDSKSKDTDADGDGIKDNVDNCPLIANVDQLDTDTDGKGNVCDTDDDGDGTPDASDAFPLDDTEDTDTDGDGTGDNTDTDDDGDGIPDASDAFPLDDTENTDADGDGTGDNADDDDDNDGTPDASDDFPLDDTEDTDTDGDGTGDNADTDDDGDGTPDATDDFPLDEDEDTDTDGDGTGDNVDTDDDGDGTPDSSDDFPLDDTENIDTDGDGTGDNADADDDGDGTPDASDDFPLDEDEDTDTDGDGTGDNADTDDSNDITGKEDKVISAEAFTPNGDNINELWIIQGIENYPNAIVTVYNRYGHLVFKAANYANDWNGTFKSNSEKVPPGSYYYTIELGNGEAPLDGWIFINY